MNSFLQLVQPEEDLDGAGTYLPKESFEIEGVDISSIKGVSIGSRNFPFRKGFNPEFSRAILDSSVGERVSHSTANLVQISRSHARSLEWRLGELRHVVWQDEFGHIFTSINIKGNVFIDPEVAVSHGDQPYIILGMDNSHSLRRRILASRILRENGIPCESTERVIKPTEFPLAGKKLSQTQLKQRLIAKLLSKGQIRDLEATEPAEFDAEQAAKVADYLSNTALLIYVRAMPINERLEDLRRCRNREEFIQVIGNIFRCVNIANSYNGLETFSIDKEGDVERFLGEYIPKVFAANLAKMHNLGLVHESLSPSNILVDGSLVDLDTVRGALLGDAEVAEADISVDLVDAMESIADVYRFISVSKFVSVDLENAITLLANEYNRQRHGVNLDLSTKYLLADNFREFCEYLQLDIPRIAQEILKEEPDCSFEDLWQMIMDKFNFANPALGTPAALIDYHTFRASIDLRISREFYDEFCKMAVEHQATALQAAEYIAFQNMYRFVAENYEGLVEPTLKKAEEEAKEALRLSIYGVAEG